MPGLKAELPEALSGASALSIVEGGKTLGPFTFSGASRAVASLQGCVDLQLTDWGADPAQFRPGGARVVPIGDPEKWLAPSDLLRLRYEGGFLNALLRLGVGVDGRVEECVQVDPPKGGNVQAAACKPLLSRRLYTPARDPAGRPVKGVGTMRIILASVPASQQVR